MYIAFLSKKQIGKGAVLFLCLLVLGIGFFGVLQQNEVPVTVEPTHKAIYQGDTSKKAMALTINVDWGEEYIIDILKILENENVVVTFFPTGKWAEKNPELIKLISDKGHEIGNHGYSHPHVDQLSQNENQNEILKTEEIIKEITSKKTNLFAPPYGEKQQHVIDAAAAIGYQTIMWTIDTIDWQPERTVDQIANKVISNAQNGAIVLMHPTENTTRALPTIIKSLKEKGYELTSVSNIL